MKIQFSNAEINTERRKITNDSDRHYQVSNMMNAGMSDFDIKGRSIYRSNVLDTYKKPTIMRKNLNQTPATVSQTPLPCLPLSQALIKPDPLPRPGVLFVTG